MCWPWAGAQSSVTHLSCGPGHLTLDSGLNFPLCKAEVTRLVCDHRGLNEIIKVVKLYDGGSPSLPKRPSGAGTLSLPAAMERTHLQPSRLQGVGS